MLGGTMPQLTAWAAAHSKIVLFLDSLLRGLGQVVFLNNPVTGLFVVAAAAYNSTYIMTMGLAGTVAATLVALLFGLSPEATRGGLFGYNGFLTGAALALFQAGHSGSEWNPLVVAPVVLCSALSTLVTIALAHVCANISKDPAPCFTFPFHLVTWMWLLGSQGYAYFPNDLGSPALATPTTVDDRNLLDYDAAELFLAVPRGVAQVFLFSEFWSGEIRRGRRRSIVATRVCLSAALLWMCMSHCSSPLPVLLSPRRDHSCGHGDCLAHDSHCSGSWLAHWHGHGSCRGRTNSRHLRRPLGCVFATVSPVRIARVRRLSPLTQTPSLPPPPPPTPRPASRL